MNFIVDKKMSQLMIKKLMEYGTVYKSMDIPANDSSVSSHPDMQIHFLNPDTAICPPETYLYYKTILPEHINIIKGDNNLFSTYPDIAAYNVARVGGYIICNTKIVDKVLLSYYTANSFEIIHVNQGYAKCNICIINDNCIITEDRGIYDIIRTKATEIECVFIDNGDVDLGGFDYGFIGGASGLCEDTVLFCGKLKDTPNKEIILNTIKRNNKKYAELSNEPLYDYGSIISF